MASNNDPSGFNSLTPEDQETVKNSVGGATVWDGLGRFKKQQAFDRVMKSGVLAGNLEPAKKAQRVGKIGGSVLMLALAAWVISSCMPKSAEEKAADIASTREKTCHDPIMAWIEAKDMVSAHLKAPSTAVFGSRGESTITPYKDCEFDVSGWVDAQNSFGAKLRSRYLVDLKYLKDKDKWVPVKVTVN
ncbi:hypothetical protein [Rhodoferax sp.]|uniref:hypothetical protein n=1 Tax=Rhodoferax sp. TaxID=50421 RepID=UPI002845CE5B|nr:hypothetical protein [Rhodoferax sp.]MDR3369581.1 hypothetical protein [Rhodoferax sp.]